MSLPEMPGGWDELFDESYLRAYAPLLDEERIRTEVEGALRIARVATGAEILDAPTGFARHAVPLADAGYRVTGIDRSEVQLAEARRRSGDREWPRLLRVDYRDLPFDEESFDAVLCLFTSLGYLDRAGDVGVLAEFRRVLRPGAPLVLETMHRDRLARIFLPHTWERLDDGTFFLQERAMDWVSGEVATEWVFAGGGSDPVARTFVHRVYTAGEWASMLREAGFERVECFGDWDGEAPPSPDTRLIVRAS